MAGDTPHRGNPSPDQQATAFDPELARQARQAESRSGGPDGGGLEPHDSRNITGVGGGGTGTPGGADQQDGGARWGGDAQQPHDVAAGQPDATTAAGQQPGIDRREIEAEQQAGSRPARLDPAGREPAPLDSVEVWSGDAQPNPAASIEPSPEAQHMASAHVPGFDQRQNPNQAQGGQQSQSADGGMRQQTDPNRQASVDQQSASLGGIDQQDRQQQARARQVQQQQQQSRQS